MARGDKDQRRRLLPDDQIEDGVAVALLSNLKMLFERKLSLPSM